LCIIAASSGLRLGFVNKITYVDPLTESLNKFKKLSQSQDTFEMLEQNDGDILYFAKSDDEIPIYAFLAKSVSVYGGKLTMYVLIKDNKIFKIAQGDNKETYFSTVEKANFYEKFYNIDLLTAVDFSTLDADLVTGATKTSRAVSNAINTTKNYYNDYISSLAGGNN
jgi:hypothetical protein